MPSTAQQERASTPSAEVQEAAGRACAQIAPAWPLDRFIAVSPFWPQVSRPMSEAAARLASLGGASLLMPRAYYRALHRAGRLREEHLQEALARSPDAPTLSELLAQLEKDEEPPSPRPRFVDIVDQRAERGGEVSYREHVVGSISQLCAAYFDDGQASLSAPKSAGLYGLFCAQMRVDRSPELILGLPSLRTLARELPAAPLAMIEQGLIDLGLPSSEYESYLLCLLLDVQGWAAHCAYRRHCARLTGSEDDHLIDLLAVRIAWEWLLWRACGPDAATAFRSAVRAYPSQDLRASSLRRHDWIYQAALELAYQEELCRRLPTGFLAAPQPALAQLVFCIDVRSEVMRRAIEAQSPQLRTLGFAGFFGLPVDYQGVGSELAWPQLPGLLAPRYRITDAEVPTAVADRRRQRLQLQRDREQVKSSGLSSFAFVEALGMLSLPSLLADAWRLLPGVEPERAALSPSESALRQPRLSHHHHGAELSTDERCEVAAGVLRAMSLTQDFARWVLLFGHASRSENNAHAASLQCGACGGQSGEINARAAAELLNDAAVRKGLVARGIQIPTATLFVAGLHNTTTDELTLFAPAGLPLPRQAELRELREQLDAASAQARRERAPALGLDSRASDDVLRAELQQRSRDYSQVRPEWGLANHAAFVIAPRERTRHLDLAGRVFLHEYRAKEDPEHSTLELLMTAPLLVAHWINMQYYASMVDPQQYGSGNKVLHNVVGGHLGVFEGNSGDLRIGLPRQSLHDGQSWMHTPLRLSVFIEAPRSAIESVLRKHATVRSLVDNQWLWLFQLAPDERRVLAYRDGTWQPVAQRPSGRSGSTALYHRGPAQPSAR